MIRTTRREGLVSTFLHRSGQVPLLIAIDTMTNAQSLESIFDNMLRVQVLILRILDPNHIHIVRSALARSAMPRLQYLNISLCDGDWEMSAARVMNKKME